MTFHLEIHFQHVRYKVGAQFGNSPLTLRIQHRHAFQGLVNLGQIQISSMISLIVSLIGSTLFYWVHTRVRSCNPTRELSYDIAATLGQKHDQIGESYVSESN